ncbi:hypothetical protein AVEN_245061-1 [Araneus ventricosus]|uniref:Uncharacterized protein n=1 Tax=Araneus ventricosus TaxID=182803 RepID=A0A4Y2E942_ARAVE|nr:hypothetical protein AVEN_245061-1 [Araneus ventricosus]
MEENQINHDEEEERMTLMEESEDDFDSFQYETKAEETQQVTYVDQSMVDFLRNIVGEKKECEREREERERERDRAFELQKLELEVRAASAQPVESMHVPDGTDKIRMHDVMPLFNPKEDDVSLFLVLFERQAKIMNIDAENQVTQLISLLPPDIVQLIAREPEEDAKKYEYVKALLLQRFKLSAEKFRQLFNKHQKASESTWYDFYYELKNYLVGHFMDKWTTIISPTEMVKKIEDFEDVRKTIKPKFFATKAERTNKEQFKSRYEIFSKGIELSHHSKHTDKWDNYRHRKDHRQRLDARQRDRFQNRIKMTLLTKDIDNAVSSAGQTSTLNRNALR